MIEITFDEHLNNSFKGLEPPILTIPDLSGKPFKAYFDYAKEIFRENKESLYLIVFEDKKLFDINKLALAFFICSCLEPENPLECLVVKTLQIQKAIENYKPYIALSIGLKYALFLASESTTNIYKEIKLLTYFNFSIKENYAEETITYQTNGNQELKHIETFSAFDTLIYVSLLKILSLANIEENINLVVHTTKDSEMIDKEKLIEKILEKTKPYINI